jgi:hypothetical protein
MITKRQVGAESYPSALNQSVIDLLFDLLLSMPLRNESEPGVRDEKSGCLISLLFQLSTMTLR